MAPAPEVTFSNVPEIIGIIGGFVIAISLFPQVLKTWSTKSATDISYVYQGIYITGCTMVNVYAIMEKLWPVYFPCLLEESLVITLTLMKIYYDRHPSKNKKDTKANNTKPIDKTQRQQTFPAEIDENISNLEEGTKYYESSSSDVLE